MHIEDTVKNTGNNPLSRLQTSVAFEDKKILLIGDTIVDHYTYGSVIGTSLETPTLVAKELEQKFSLGGSFLVCRNLLNLKAQVTFITLAGSDPEGRLIEAYEHPHLTLTMIHEEGRRTTIKRRYWVDHYKLLQMDVLDNRPLSDEINEEIFSLVSDHLEMTSSLVISDYRHGLLSESLITNLVRLAKEKNVPCLVDSQLSKTKGNHHLYKGAYLICLNQKEAHSVCSEIFDPKTKEDLLSLKKALQIENIVVKRGEHGAVALIGNQFFESNAIQVRPVDTCGAGDAFLAALSVTSLHEPQVALDIANIWAGLAITTHGPQPPTWEEFQQYINQEALLV